MLKNTDTPQDDRLRDVFEEPLFSEQLESLAIGYERLDAVMESVVFELARDPGRFPQVQGTCLSVVTIELYDSLPSVRFLFTFDDERVTLVAVDFGGRRPR
ncbi:MAG TPA: hypothetical protein VEU96_03700 [Bryobacteraceae bacterium]|nr:hypothetical protein [Bryobacteraceae bacterium]